MVALYILLGTLLGLVAGGVGVYLAVARSAKGLMHKARDVADRDANARVREAEAKAREIEVAARHDALAARESVEKELDDERRATAERVAKLADAEARLAKREDAFDRKHDVLTFKERQAEDATRALAKRESACAAHEAHVDQLRAEERTRLAEVAGLSMDQARERLLNRLETELKGECGDLVRRHVEQAHEEAREKGRMVVLAAIQRYAAEQTADATVASLHLPDDAMKGRVIGREGRNIRAFEKATGVDLVIDDTPGVVAVSCFDPVRREIAKLTLERLIADGRIHPARIEEMVIEVTAEMEEKLLTLGKDAAATAHLHNLPKQLFPLLGRLNYRTSYGQNVLKHSLEVAFLAQTMAAELGLDPTVARRAGLLHDIGKALDHEQEGGHPQLGHDLLKKLGESDATLNAALAHHGDVPASTPYTALVMAADAISASRPGARRESLERYVKRLQELEALAAGFDGVRQAYAIQAGREVRVIVDARLVDDRNTARLARDIAKKVEAEMSYPGEVKVTVLREVRTVEYAR